MTNDRNIKTKLLEIGYTLKKELDNTSLIESMDRDINNRANNMGPLDVKRLLEDNIQLFNEKERVLKQNKELREILDSKLQIYETKLGMITSTMSDVKQTIETLRR
jgi:hypothetical protein